MKLKSDKYKNNRGGHSRLLSIKCVNCRKHNFYYQKDGPGILKRLYSDRIYLSVRNSKKLTCAHCKAILGVATIYKKERRPAYQLFAGTISKKIIAADKVGFPL